MGAVIIGGRPYGGSSNGHILVENKFPTEIRLVRSRPGFPSANHTYYVVAVQGTEEEVVGRVRMTDGEWTAAVLEGGQLVHLGGNYRSRYTAVQGVLYKDGFDD